MAKNYTAVLGCINSPQEITEEVGNYLVVAKNTPDMEWFNSLIKTAPAPFYGCLNAGFSIIPKTMEKVIGKFQAYPEIAAVYCDFVIFKDKIQIPNFLPPFNFQNFGVNIPFFVRQEILASHPFDNRLDFQKTLVAIGSRFPVLHIAEPLMYVNSSS